MNVRQARSRSVLGCLTCRRRKVKCRSQETPCDTCRRLGILCKPSFTSNFREWKRQHSHTPSESSPTPLQEEPWLTPECPLNSLPAGRLRESPYASPSPTENSPSTPFTARQVALGWGQTVDGDQSIYDWSFCQWPLEADTVSATDDVAGGITPELCSSYAGIQDQGIIDELSAGGLLNPAGSSETTRNSIYPIFPERRCAALGETLSGESFSHLHTSSAPSNLPIPLDWNLHYSSPSIDDEHALVDYYKYHLSSFFSTKAANSTSWNFYSYAILSTERHTDSPLRHGILAWTSAHLILTDKSSSGDALYRHYTRARSATNDLLAELAVEADVLGLSPPATKKLNMLLSTSLFLGFCDILSGDIDALASSLSGIKRLLESHWEQFHKRLGSLESRILIWLAYLDLRTNFWTATNLTGPQSARSVAEHGQVHEKGNLFHFLMTRKGFSSLRSTCGGRYYLSECFGSSYPEQELKEDLLQEPAKLLSDDALSIFGRILELEAWCAEISAKDPNPGSLVEELRSAKLQAIRSDIARGRAECKLIHAELMDSSTGADHIIRTERHSLATTALHLSAIILLSRIASPNLRTDDEAQGAARQIIHIARRLQKLGFCSPPSLIWPLPVFIAGIEVMDEIYQDWVLEYMRKLAGFGYSTLKARELLRRVIDQQTATGKRVQVRDVMSEFAGDAHILV